MTNVTAFVLISSVIALALRILPPIVTHRTAVPERVLAVLHHVPTAIFAALIALDVLFWDGAFNLNPLENWKLIAALVAGLVAWWTKSLAATMIVGVAALLLFLVLF